MSKEINTRISYPAVTRTEGIGPQQYGTKSLLGNKFADIEEKYDLSRNAEGFGSEGEEDEESDDNDLSEATDEMGENDDL